MSVRHKPNESIRGLRESLPGQICDALGIDGYGSREEALVYDLAKKIDRHCQRVARAAAGGYNSRLASAVAEGKKALEREPQALAAFIRFCGSVMGAMG
ncbi:hypothetical protein ACXU4B_06150 [Dyella soli]|uniref:Uncharacterized protein n=1 Tax=Dyella soli TaxID=522319 RepID=A0A4R0YVG2_9GAMM|nr:hypothetical protein [Dyella soli]TCI10572.1 hypothetical protein EZM97_17040 [Dyella soli]